jgi:hypothetical protein
VAGVTASLQIYGLAMHTQSLPPPPCNPAGFVNPVGFSSVLCWGLLSHLRVAFDHGGGCALRNEPTDIQSREVATANRLDQDFAGPCNWEQIINILPNTYVVFIFPISFYRYIVSGNHSAAVRWKDWGCKAML